MAAITATINSPMKAMILIMNANICFNRAIVKMDKIAEASTMATAAKDVRQTTVRSVAWSVSIVLFKDSKYYHTCNIFIQNIGNDVF